MPNYSLVVDSTFKPFTYEELMAPVRRMSDVHDQIAAQYEDLSSKADILEAMGEQDKQSDAYKRYLEYSGRLMQEADLLMRQGLSGTSRARLMGMKRDYNKTIVPIQNAWNKREEEAKEQKTLLSSNPSMMFTRTAANTSIDDYIANPTGGYGIINGANIAKQMSDMVKHLADGIKDGSISSSDVDPYTKAFITRPGLTEGDIMMWMENPDKFPTLSKMRDQVLKANGVTEEALSGSPNKDMIIDSSMGHIGTAVWDAIGKPSVSIKENPVAMAALKDSMSAREQARDFAYKVRLAQLKNAGDPDYPVVLSTNTGVETTEAYTSNGLAALNELKAGNDGLKASYFGKKLGSVNPIEVYNEYQKLLQEGYKKAMKASDTTVRENEYGQLETVPTVGRAENVKKAAREQIQKKYGITDILSDRQYEILKGMGFDEKTKFTSDRFSTYVAGFNNLVKQKTAYDLPMASGGYDIMNQNTTNALVRNDKHLGDKVYLYEGYKRSATTIKSVSDMGVDLSKNKISTIGYDPNHKGFIRVTYDTGQTFLMKPELVGGANLANYIKELETKPMTNMLTGEVRMATPEEITAGLIKHVNGYNQKISASSSDAIGG